MAARTERESSTEGTQSLESSSDSALVTSKGRTSIADAVVAKIAGIAAREISGVHNMGTGSARAVGAIREMIPGGSASSPTQGVRVEVGERQAAIDIDLVVEYGVSIVDLAEAVRQNVISRIEGITGLQATEVNISIDDVWLGEQEQGQEEPPPDPRVE